ncbi:AAA domain containing protein [uncultured Caudovirales phage]|uniref:AAA domain containing protein n=1 Tax=uncultured Caudovirales phage TaxID=2100421 RepID=A0A6J5LDR0_9CAUD|nr:AAA domain containing protein [uncultured Caudovirales phage]
MTTKSKPTAYILVGLPASGKSFYIDNVLKATYYDAVVLSTDNYVERFAARLKKTYSQVFDSCMPRAIRLMMRSHRRAYSQKKDIIWDQTSLTVNSRRKKINALRGYELIAIVMNTGDSLVDGRVVSRPGKTIPPSVMQQMRSSYVPPTEGEGFSKVIFITTVEKEENV